MTPTPGVRPLVIVGAGGFGRECLSIVAAINEVQPTWQVQGVIDDRPPNPDLLARLDTAWLGPIDSLRVTDGSAVTVAIGDPSARHAVVERLSHLALSYATLIHPAATIGLDVRIEPGCTICSHASLTTGVTLGHHVHIDQNATVGHDVTLGDFTRVNPNGAVSGNVTLGAGALIGANATVLQGRHVGPGAVVGAGAVVTVDVPPAVTVIGVPAKPMARHRTAGAP